MSMRAIVSAAAVPTADESEAGDGDPPDAPAPGADSRPRSRSPAPIRILLVEDDYLVGMEVEAGLGEAGYEVIGIAATAIEAVTLAAVEHPRLVVMDIRLAGERDGVDAALEIHRRLGIRCVFASAHVDAEVRARAKAARPLAWIGKPYRVSALLAAVEKALADLEE